MRGVAPALNLIQTKSVPLRAGSFADTMCRLSRHRSVCLHARHNNIEYPMKRNKNSNNDF